MRLLFALVFMMLPVAAIAQSCAEIKFARGAYSGDVVGVAPANGLLCYTIGVGNGQTAYVEILEGPNVAFTIPGVAEVQDFVQFPTRAGLYQINVFQWSRAAVGQGFRMRITVR